MTVRAPSPQIDTLTQIRQLEDQRYAAMLRGSAREFADLCHPDLVYTHSDGSQDTLQSYMEKLEQNFYVYERIEHPIDDILLVNNTAVVVGSMKADILAKGEPKRLGNLCLSVWVYDAEKWKLLAFAPTPMKKLG